MELKKAYPNYVLAINQMKDTTDLTKGRNNSEVISHTMAFTVFGNNLGHIYIDLNKYSDFIYVSCATFKGFAEKAKTTGERIYRDLTVEEWIAEISAVINKHNLNPDHTQLLMDFNHKKVGVPSTKSSGCVVTILLFVLPLITYFI